MCPVIEVSLLDKLINLGYDMLKMQLCQKGLERNIDKNKVKVEWKCTCGNGMKLEDNFLYFEVSLPNCLKVCRFKFRQKG